jgi:tyrosine aminotransferase
MVGIDVEKFEDIGSDLEFSQKLLREQSVFVLPGQIFRAPNFFRIVFCPPPDKLTTVLALYCLNFYYCRIVFYV